MHPRVSVLGLSLLIIAFIATTATAQTLQDLFRDPRVIEARDNVLTAADDLNSSLADFREETERSLSMPSKVARACVLLALEYLRESNAIGEATAASGAFLATEVALFIVKGQNVFPKVFREKCLNVQNPEFGSGPNFPLPFALQTAGESSPSLPAVPLNSMDDEHPFPALVGPGIEMSNIINKVLAIHGIRDDLKVEFAAYAFALGLAFGIEPSPSGLPSATGADVIAQQNELPEDVRAHIEELKTEVNAIDLKLYELEALLIDAEVLVNSCVNNLLEALASLQLARRPVVGAESNTRKKDLNLDMVLSQETPPLGAGARVDRTQLTSQRPARRWECHQGVCN